MAIAIERCSTGGVHLSFVTGAGSGVSDRRYGDGDGVGPLARAAVRGGDVPEVPHEPVHAGQSQLRTAVDPPAVIRVQGRARTFVTAVTRT